MGIKNLLTKISSKSEKSSRVPPISSGWRGFLGIINPEYISYIQKNCPICEGSNVTIDEDGYAYDTPFIEYNCKDCSWKYTHIRPW